MSGNPNARRRSSENDDFSSFKSSENKPKAKRSSGASSKQQEKAQSEQENKHSSDDANDISLTEFLMNEMSLKSISEKQYLNVKVNDVSRVFHFLNVVQHLFYLLSFGWLICLDSFLFLFTFLPIRLACSTIMKGMNCLKYILARLFKRERREERWNVGFEIAWRADLIRISLLVITVFFLDRFVHITQHYHWIRTQSTFKLYVIFNMLQVLDRLCCFFGEDLFTALFGNMINSFCESSEQSFEQKSNLNHKISYVRKMLSDYALTWIVGCLYVIFHSYILTIHIVALTVAINSNDTSLVVLLVSSNFVEIKGSAFKRYSQENLFQLAAAGMR
jgi:hypothetical protein